MDFATFYSLGGVFMHIITLCSLGAIAALVLHAKERRSQPDTTRGLDLAANLALACLGLGLLGTLFGFADLTGALQSVEEVAKWPRPLAKGFSIALITTHYGLMTALPLGAGVAFARWRRAGDLAQRAPAGA